ncbi:MAG: PilN domain-containing protein [Candidatus Omnitrophica bacterium]|nr:PilN domain-containing protein [Candidatus Omnitrophota bacterium]
MLKNVIYITRKKIRFAQFGIRREATKLLKDKSIALNADKPLGEVLKEITRRERLDRKDFISCFFRYQVSLRFFTFPSNNLEEISKMVSYEAAELLPLKSEEVVTRYLVLNKQKSGYSDTLIVVVHKDEVLKFSSYFQGTGCSINILSLSSLALFSCIKKVVAEKDKSFLEKNIMLVHFEDGTVEIIAVNKGRLVLSRGFLLHSVKNFYQMLIGEIRQNIELFFTESKERSLDQIIISGFADLQGIEGVLKGHFNVPILINKCVDIALGLALCSEQSVNLLSNEAISLHLRKNFSKKIMSMFLLLFFNLILLGAAFSLILNNKNDYLNRIEQKLALLKPEAQSVQNKLAQLNMMQKQLHSQILILDAITELINSASSSSIMLNMLTINEEGILIMRGQANNLQEVLDFIKGLELSPYFQNTHLSYSSLRKLMQKEVLDFEIQAELNKEH